MAGYLLDTSIISVYYDASDPRQVGRAQAIAALPPESDLFVSSIALAEIEFGINLAKAVSKQKFQALEAMIARARQEVVLDINKHTAACYAEIKARVANRYLASTLRRNRPTFVDDWVDQSTGKVIAIDENDLWMCAQAKERDLTLLTAERRMSRISDADPTVRIIRIC